MKGTERELIETSHNGDEDAIRHLVMTTTIRAAVSFSRFGLPSKLAV
jgi:hypothetical protein